GTSARGAAGLAAAALPPLVVVPQPPSPSDLAYRNSSTGGADGVRRERPGVVDAGEAGAARGTPPGRAQAGRGRQAQARGRSPGGAAPPYLLYGEHPPHGADAICGPCGWGTRAAGAAWRTCAPPGGRHFLQGGGRDGCTASLRERDAMPPSPSDLAYRKLTRLRGARDGRPLLGPAVRLSTAAAISI